MKNTFIFFYIIIFCIVDTASAEENSCETNFPLTSSTKEMAEDFQIPNCTNKKTLQPTLKGDFSKLCNECKVNFDKKTSVLGIKPQSDLSLINIKKYLTDELTKSLSSQILDISNLRETYPVKSSFKKSIDSCNFDKFKETLNSKKCDTGFDFKKLQKQLNTELAYIYKDSPNQTDTGKDGILNRNTEPPLCPISDISIIRARSHQLEKELSEEVIGQIQNMKFESEKDLQNSLSELSSKQKTPFDKLFLYHPIFSRLVKYPKKFKSFFSNLSKPISPESLRGSLYGSQDLGEQIDNDIAEKCSKAFKTFEEAACSDSVKNNKIRISDIKALNKVMDMKTSPDIYIDTKDSLKIESNFKLTRFCDHISNDPKAPDLTATLKEITDGMPEEYAIKTFDIYKEFKYESEIKSLRKKLCELTKNPNCNPSEYECRLYKTMNDTKDPSTPEGRLASSGSQSVNELLHSIIGNAPDLAPDVKQVLVKEGILPQSNGQFVQQPKVPEREPDYFKPSSSTANTHHAAPAQRTSSATRSTSSAQADRGYNYSSNLAPVPASASTGATTNDSSPQSFDDPEGDEELDRVKKEIMRRLANSSANPESSKKPSRSDARKTMQDMANQQKRSISPARQEQILDQLQEAGAFSDSDIAQAIPESNKAKMSPGDDARAQFAKQQKLEALSAMAGNLATSKDHTPGNSGNDANGKSLERVSMKVAEDKIQLNLSDILNDKVLKNDSQTQMIRSYIRNKQDFILDLNRYSYKVRFDKEQKKYLVDVESGDYEEATKIKPQLESFIQKINSTTPSIP